jgi:hypothetical protein
MAVQIVVRFQCEHQQTIAEQDDAPPVCKICGCDRLRRVDAPAPRFTGVAQGPLVRQTHG